MGLEILTHKIILSRWSNQDFSERQGEGAQD